MNQDYRKLWGQYNNGSAQGGTVAPNQQHGFNFLQGWRASPHAGYVPPQQARPVNQFMGQPGGQMGQNGGQNNFWGAGVDPRSMLGDGINGNYAAWLRAYKRPSQNQPQVPYQQPYQQYDQFGKPVSMDTTNPGGSTITPWGGG